MSIEKFELDEIQKVIDLMKKNKLTAFTGLGIHLEMHTSGHESDHVVNPDLDKPNILAHKEKPEIPPQRMGLGEMPPDDELLFASTHHFREPNLVSALDVFQNPGLLNQEPEPLKAQE